MKKNNHLQKQLKFHCPACKSIYQLLELQPKNDDKCSANCLEKWQEICHDYHKEKTLAHLSLQEEANEKALEKSQELPDWLKKVTK
jgi:hypothetical protein